MSEAVYRGVLGSRLDDLPEPVRALHSPGTSSTWRGTAKVRRGANPLAWLICSAFRFPKSNDDCPLTLTITHRDGVEHWQRDFDGQVMASIQRAGLGRDAGYLVEQFGAVRVVLELRVESGRLAVIPLRWSVVGVPMPGMLRPRGESYESARDGAFHFDVEIKGPLVGTIVTYKGTLMEERQ